MLPTRNVCTASSSVGAEIPRDVHWPTHASRDEGATPHQHGYRTRILSIPTNISSFIVPLLLTEPVAAVRGYDIK